MSFDWNALAARLVRHEGLRLKPYTDSVGKLTIGIGRNLTDCGISEAEAHMLLANDIAGASVDLDHHVPKWRGLDDVRQAVLVELCFAMGWPVLSEFHDTLQALSERRFPDAARHLRGSLWARQVGARAEELAAAIETGSFPPG